MKKKYVFVSCALVAALIAGIAQARSDQDAGKRRAGESGKTVELIFKTPPGGVVFEPDQEIELARIDTSSYRRIRLSAGSAAISTGLPGFVTAYEGELEMPLLAVPTQGGTAIIDVPGEFIILKGRFAPEIENTPVHAVVYGER